MNKNQYNINNILQSALKNIHQIMLTHQGVDFVIKSRLKFEKWFQIELLRELLILTKKFPGIELRNEYPISQKNSKKGETIDLVILNNKNKYIGIELKIIPTNYESDGFKKSTKAITDSINEMISDLNKPLKDDFPNSISIAFVFPFPLKKDHRNNSIDFQRQIKKLENAGHLKIIDSNSNSNYNSKFILLSNSELKAGSLEV